MVGHHTLNITSPILAGLSVTMAPAFSRAATLSLAAPDHNNQYSSRNGLVNSGNVPFPPEIIAPACPMRLPGGAVRPAMKATTGFGFFRVLLCFSKYSAASSSILPPISPIRTIPESVKYQRRCSRRRCSNKPSVLSSSRNNFTTSMCLVPGKGSPPMPTQSD